MAFETLTEDDFFQMSKLPPRITGLSFHIWAVNNVRQQPLTPRLRIRAIDSEFYPVSINEPVEFLGDLPPGWTVVELGKLQQFVALNRQVLLEHWEDRIDTRELIGGLQSLKDRGD